MNKEENIYKRIFTLRKGGANGEKFFITIGNMVLSSKLHDTEEEAFKELEEVNLETITKMLIAVMSAFEEMFKINNKKTEE